MVVLEAVDLIRTRLQRKASLRAYICLTSVSGVFFLAAASILPLSAWGAGLVFALGLTLAVWKVHQTGDLRPVSRLVAAQELDNSLRSKDRVLSFSALAAEGAEPDSRRELLAFQLAEVLKTDLVHQTVALSLTAAQRVLLATGVGGWVCGFLLIVWIYWPAAIKDPLASRLLDLAQAEVALPPQLRHDLVELAQKIENSGLASAEASEALLKTEQSLSQAKEHFSSIIPAIGVFEASQPTPPLAPLKSTPTPTPTPTATPTTQAAVKPSPEQSSSQETDIQHATQGGQGDKKADQAGQGESEKDSKEGQAGTQNKESGAAEQSQDKKSPSEQGSGGQGQQGKDAKRDSAGSSGTQEHAADSQQQPGQSGEAKQQTDGQGQQQSQQALEKVEQALEALKQEMQQQQKGQEPNSDSKQQQTETAGNTSNQSAEEGKNKQEEEGQSGQPQGQPAKADADKSPEEKAQSERKNPPDNKGSDKGKGRESPMPDREAKLRSLDESELGEESAGLGDRKQFNEVKIGPAQEKYDPNFASDTGEVSKNEKEAAFKTDLADIKQARPEVPKQEAKQPIPLEYKDIMH